jgi:hypothetical protein
MAISNEASKKCGIANGVDGVTSIFGVAPKRYAYAALQHVVVTTSGSDSLSEPQVRPRTHRNCSVGFDHAINLVVIEVYCVSE